MLKLMTAFQIRHIPYARDVMCSCTSAVEGTYPYYVPLNRRGGGLKIITKRYVGGGKAPSLCYVTIKILEYFCNFIAFIDKTQKDVLMVC